MPGEVTCPALLHGSIYAYVRYGCRCPDAVDTIRAAWRQNSRRHAPGKGRQGRRRKGFDPVAVERACGGDRQLPLSTAELTAAVAKLTRLGNSAEQIAVRLGVTSRTVQRHRGRVHSVYEAVDP
jgi:DNA-binding NarL/FixJ family response regulator